MSRVLILGAGGQLGRDLAAVLSADHEVHAAARAECDVTDAARVAAVLDEARPDVVVNCAAHTRVDACEAEPEQALELNGRAVERLAALARERGALLVHFSTDYVFDGRSGRPYREDDPTNPQSVYGRTKLAGERAALALGEGALVVRTQWLYGPGERNFVRTILTRARCGEALSVVDDQRGSPTCTRDVADAVAALLARDRRGLYHVANSGEASWFEFARAILELTGTQAPLSPCATDRGRYPAPRPAYSALDTGKLARDTGHRPRPWRAALRAYLEREGLLAG